MSLSPLDSDYPDAYTTPPTANLVRTPRTFFSTILKQQLRKRRRHRAFAQAGRVIIGVADQRVAVPPECTVVGHLCPVEVAVQPAGRGSLATVDMHDAGCSVMLWTAAGATVVTASGTVRTRLRIAAVEVGNAPAQHGTICSGTNKAAMRAASDAGERPGVTVWAAPLMACQYAILLYDTQVGWECPQCRGAWPTAGGLLAHFNCTGGKVARLMAGVIVGGAAAPVFTTATPPAPRGYAINVVNPAALRGRLTVLARGARPVARVPQPRLTIAPHW